MEKKIEAIAAKACSRQGVALYDLEIKPTNKGLLVLVYITKVSGVTVDDCTKISRFIDHELEELDLIEQRHFLEVSSPGLERELKYKKHFNSAINEKVKVTYQDDGKSITIIGHLRQVLPDKLVIEKDAENHEIQFQDIKKAKTYFDYKR
jgi:ribosome maturation factor RimP